MFLKKIIATCLMSALVFTSTAVAFADSNFASDNNNNLSVREIEQVGFAEGLDDNYTVERTISDKKIESVVKDVDGELLAKAVTSNGNVVITDYTANVEREIVIEVDDLLNVADGVIVSSTENMGDRATTSIKWGSWSSKTSTVKIPKLTVAAFLAAVSVLCPYMSVSALSAAASVFIAGGYSYATVKVRTRYGTDSNYQYSEEEVTIWGRHSKTGTKTKIYGPGVWQQKKSLNS